MSEMKGGDLPAHVSHYLEKHKVDPEELPDNVREAFAGMSTREIEFLGFIGNEMREGGVDTEIIARIH